MWDVNFKILFPYELTHSYTLQMHTHTPHSQMEQSKEMGDVKTLKVTIELLQEQLFKLREEKKVKCAFICGYLCKHTIHTYIHQHTPQATEDKLRQHEETERKLAEISIKLDNEVYFYILPSPSPLLMSDSNISFFISQHARTYTQVKAKTELLHQMQLWDVKSDSQNKLGEYYKVLM